MRPSYLTRARVVSAVVVGVAATLLAPLSPASGDITTLCSGYRGCQAEGKGSAGYARANDRMYWQMYAGHNCTNYVAYRLVRKGMANSRPWDGPGNATYWGKEMPRRTDKRPRVGSVAWWKAGTSRGGSTGHVAYVERVVSRSEIVVSQDSWGGDFSWARITRSGGWPNGFIHLRDTPLRRLEAPGLSGTPRVGERLSASRASWDPRPAAVRYRWLVGGRPVRGADTRSLRLTRPMLGKRVEVRAVARRVGYPRSEVTSRATRAIRPGLLSLSRRPDLRGGVRVGKTLRVSSGSWSPRPARVSHRWYADGERIRRAQGATLRLRPGMAGARIAVQVTARRPGYEPSSRTVRTRHRVAPGRLRAAAAPTLRGDPRRGAVLRVRLGQSSPQAAVRRVQWLRDGRPVKGATTRAYRLGRADLGHRLRAQVRYQRKGYRTLTLLTGSSGWVKTAPKVRVSAERGRRGVRLEVVAKGARRPLNTGVVVTHRGRVIARDQVRRGTATMRLTGLRPGRRTVKVLVRATPITDRLVVVRKVRVRR